jgi:branched-chain amino acid transport system ATP-binding protein
VLTVENISTQYDGLNAISSITMEVQNGGFVCIIGPNGAGKSTLLQTIIGLLKPIEGKIVFEGKAISGLNPHEISSKGISLVPEEGWLFPQMSVHENLLMGAYPSNARKKIKIRLEEVYSLFPILKERTKQFAETLSGGERQMLAVGRGLMSSPRLLLLDEPSLGLAPIIIKDILRTLIQINDEKKIAILLTEQNIFHALNTSRYCYLLENGKIVMEGRSAELLNNEHIKTNYLGF